MSRALSWFKHGYAWDAKFTGFKNNNRCWNRITVFSMDNDRNEAVQLVIAEAAKYGYSDVTIDKLVRV